jgi:xanthine dehydrogenase accessory factor
VLGFETIVVDSRTAFATPERFGHATQLVVRWPADALAELRLDEGCYVVVLTHDAKIDDPALARAVQSPARYVGALGSRRTHEKRLASLRALGVPDAALARIHAPIGLDLGGRAPEEIALAIMAEIVAVRNGRAA